jgi:integrase/recombinase XerD
LGISLGGAVAVDKLLGAIERYLTYRLSNDFGVELGQAHIRGLIADLPLILSRRGYAYSLNRKLRRSETGDVTENWAADSLQAYVTGLGGEHERFEP